MKELADLLHKRIIENFVLQGHSLNGAFEKSLNYVIENGQGFSTITFYGKKYAKYLENGVSAAKIPYTPHWWPTARTGKKKSLYIEALIRYCQLRKGLDEKEARRMAFAVAYKHKTEGMPTKASYQFSQTGKRTQFITDVLKSDEVKDILQRQIGYTIQNKINEFNDKKQTSTEVSFSM